VIVSDLRRSLEFYLEVLGMEDDTHTRNPRLPFGGAFVKAGNTQIHLMLSDNTEIPEPSFRNGRPEHGGRDYHIALTVAAIEPIESRLRKKGIAFTMSRSGRRALFCRDPDGNALEFIETPGIQ
jgi:glyoxylase I family protein